MRCGRMKHEGASMGGSGAGGREDARRPDAFSSRGLFAKSGRGLTVHAESKEMKLQPIHPSRQDYFQFVCSMCVGSFFYV
jgi:hypothetical protein